MTRREKILRILAGHGPLTTIQMAGLLGEDASRTRMLIRCGDALRGLEPAGLVTRAGRAPGDRGTQLWALSDTGRALLARKDAARRDPGPGPSS